jgi:hypothetical protein
VLLKQKTADSETRCCCHPLELDHGCVGFGQNKNAHAFQVYLPKSLCCVSSGFLSAFK